MCLIWAVYLNEYSCPPLGGAKASGDGEEISATITMQAHRKVAGVKPATPPDDQYKLFTKWGPIMKGSEARGNATSSFQIKAKQLDISEHC